MFDSPFLSDGSKPIRGAVLTYVSLVIIFLSLLYFFVALCWEIRVSRKRGKTKRQIMWSKLKGFKHKVVEDSRNKAKEDKLSRLFNKAKSKPFATKALSIRSAASTVTSPSKDDPRAEAIRTTLPEISSSDSNNVSVHSSSSSSRKEYTSSTESSSGSSIVSTSDSSNESIAADADVYSSADSSDTNGRERGWSFATSDDGEVAFEETKGFQLPADEKGDVLPISRDQGETFSDNATRETGEIANTSEEESLSTSSSSNDTDEISTSSGTTSNNVVDGAENSAVKKPRMDENYSSQKPSIAPVEADFEAVKLEGDTVGGDRGNQNYSELHQDTNRTRRRSVSSSHDFDFDNYEEVPHRQHHSRRRSHSSSVDFDNDDHIEAKMHKLALGTYDEDLSTSSSNGSDSSSEMSDSSTEIERKKLAVNSRRERSDSTFAVLD